MKSNKTKRVNFSIPENTLIKLEVYSKESLIPKSSLITKLLEEFFDKTGKLKI